MSYQQMVLWVRRVLTNPVDELNRWQRSLRYFIDLIRHCGRQLVDDRAEEMAAALTYRTIFSLVPLLVLGLVIFRIFGGFEEMQKTLFDFFGFTAIEYRQPDDAFDTPPVTEESAVAPGDTVVVEVPDLEQERREEQEQKVREDMGIEPAPDVAAAEAEDEAREQQSRQISAQVLLTDLLAQIDNLSFTSIGVAGLMVFIYAAMTLVLAVEYDFNTIFKSPTGRPWHLRIPIYWSVITLGAGLLALSLYLTGQLVEEARELHVVWDSVVQLLSRILAFIVSWMMLFLLYLLIPNTRVRIQPALIGSLVAALLWELGKVGFQTYVSVTLPYNALYGSLGLIPLFLLWVYISWLIVLFGLELTYALQTLRGRRSRLNAPQGDETLLDPRWLIAMMAVIAEAFQRGKTITVEQIADGMGLPVRAVSHLVQRLVKEGMLHRVEDDGDEEDPGYTLSLPPEKIQVESLLKLGRSMSMTDRALRVGPGKEMLTQLAEAESRAATEATLATMLNGTGSEAKPA